MDAQDFLDLSRSLVFGSAADRKRTADAVRAGKSAPALTATPATLALEQAARNSGSRADYDAANRAGQADAQRAQGGGMTQVVMRKPVVTLDNAADAALSATLSAEAHREAIEASRANCFVALQTATPTVAVAAATATGILTVSLPGSTEIVGYTVSPVDTMFVLTSLQVNAWETNKGGFGICLDNFTSATRRDSQLAPLVGREWDGTITISGNFTNLSAAAAIFHGFGILCRNNQCSNAYEKSAEGGHFVDFGRILEAATQHLRLS